MAQARVIDFFATKKRIHNANPSKRRKIELTQSDLKADVTCQNVLGADAKVEKPSCHNRAANRSSRRTKPKAAPRSTRTRSRTSARKTDIVGQIAINDAFAKASDSSSDTDGQDFLSDVAFGEVTEEITSQWDEHDGPKTPNRKIRSSDCPQVPDSATTETKEIRRKAVARRSRVEAWTPKKGEDEEKEQALRRRSLASRFREKMASTSTDFEPKASEKDSGDFQEQSTSSSSEMTGSETQQPVAKSTLPSDEDIVHVLGPADPVPISPLPTTPQKAGQKSTKAATLSRLKTSMEKCKQLQKLNKEDTEMPAVTGVTKSSKKKEVIAPEVVRERLAKCGKLDTLKSKLAEMNDSLRAIRKTAADKSQAEAADKEEGFEPAEKVAAKDTAAGAAAAAPSEKRPAPAYERYEYLAKEGPPSLALPGKYQRLLTMFQGTDTVVSMLYNRQEIITFSKLQAAVQSMTRKNFEQRTLGQMKTVYPTAYTFRQEKGLPSFAKKVHGYQLTVEPNLQGLEEEGPAIEKGGKPNLSASAMLKRKRIFQDSLINMTKEHHATFLSKLNPFLEVPSSKLTRWHPRFALDSVPDIEPSDLPAAPVKVYQTAGEVLEAARGRLPSRVQEAMANVAMKSESSQPQATSSEQELSASLSSKAPKPATSAYRGIPLALLEKIRAKEAAKTQAALTRDPKEDKKTDMMERLPTLIRCLRTFYVTEKKPSLPLATVVQKLADSYDTGISPVEVESHLKLLQELAPKWLQVIEITRGKYIKIDKNMDISALITGITNLAKSRK